MIYFLSPSPPSPYQSEIIAVCGGFVWLGSPPPNVGFTLAAGQTSGPPLIPDVPVSIAIVNQHGFIVDGQSIVDVNLLTGTVIPYVIDTGASADATVAGGTVSGITILGGGGSYTAAPAVVFTGGTSGTSAAAMATLTSGTVTTIGITNSGSGYTAAPTITFTGGGMANAAPPLGITLLINWRNRLMGAGQQSNPNVVYAARVGDPYDWNYGALDSAGAFVDDPAQSGRISDPVTALIPYSNDYCIISTAHAQDMYEGDPGFGGSLVRVSENMGIVGKDAWAVDPEGYLYFVATGGLFRVYPIFEVYRPPENLTKNKWNQFFEGVAPSSTVTSLAWDADSHYLWMFFTSLTANAPSTHLVYDSRWGGLWPEVYGSSEANNNGPFCSYEYLGVNSPNSRTILLGGWDGYVRRQSKALGALDDDGTPIESYVVLGPVAPFPERSALVATTVDLGELGTEPQAFGTATVVDVGDGATQFPLANTAVADSTGMFFENDQTGGIVTVNGTVSLPLTGTLGYSFLDYQSDEPTEVQFNNPPPLGATISFTNYSYIQDAVLWQADLTVKSGPDAYSVTEGTPHNMYSVSFAEMTRRQKTCRQRLADRWFTFTIGNTSGVDNTYFSFESLTAEFDQAGMQRTRR